MSPPRNSFSLSIRNTSPASEQTSAATNSQRAVSLRRSASGSATAAAMSTTIVRGLSTYSSERRSVDTAHQSAAATTRVAAISA